eukprot:scaffold246_cov242-Pinguiococcus_pyrenoidosus.AAC.6
MPRVRPGHHRLGEPRGCGGQQAAFGGGRRALPRDQGRRLGRSALRQGGQRAGPRAVSYATPNQARAADRGAREESSGDAVRRQPELWLLLRAAPDAGLRASAGG